jgi:hypothetical protein
MFNYEVYYIHATGETANQFVTLEPALNCFTDLVASATPEDEIQFNNLETQETIMSYRNGQLHKGNN